MCLVESSEVSAVSVGSGRSLPLRPPPLLVYSSFQSNTTQHTQHAFSPRLYTQPLSAIASSTLLQSVEYLRIATDLGKPPHYIHNGH